MGLFSKKKKEEEFKKYEPTMPEPDKVLYEKEIVSPIVEIEEQEESDEEVIELKKKIQDIEEKIKQTKEKVKERTIVVREYPMAPIKGYIDESGTKIKLITIEEYLTEQAN